MQRRHILHSVSFPVMVSIAGCITGNERTDENPNGLSYFEESLIEEGIDIKQLSIVDQDTVLEYITERTTDQGLGDEIGTIAATYIRARENGLDTDRLNAIISDTERQLADWHVRLDWIEQFENNEMSPEEFTTNILNTVEFIDS